MRESNETKVLQEQDGQYAAGSHKHRQLVLGTMKVCAKSGDIVMLGKFLAENEELLQSLQRSKALDRIRAFHREGQAFEDKHGIGAVLDLADPHVKKLVRLDVLGTHPVKTAGVRIRP